MTPVENLRKAKALLEDPASWCQRDFAKLSDGRTALIDEDSAVAWCAMGALQRGGVDPGLYEASRRYLVDTMPERTKACPGPVDFNDAPGTTHPDIMSWFDRAIALAEKAP